MPHGPSQTLQLRLRYLRRLLHRQWQLAREERLDEALALDAQLDGVFALLQAQDNTSENLEYPELRAQCAELSDRVQPLLQRELGLLKREWVELQVDQELRRLADNPGPLNLPSGRRDRQTDITEPEH